MFIDELKNLRYQAKFSMEEIIPLLEEKISSIQGKEYKIDFFITNYGDSRTLDVRYLAFPKQESYIKALFSYNGFIYKYTKKDDRHDSIQKIDSSNVDNDHINFKNMMDIRENNEVFLIAKEELPIEEAFKFLVMPHEEQYYLHKDFFCYNGELDEIENTIVEFAKKKIPTK